MTTLLKSGVVMFVALALTGSAWAQCSGKKAQTASKDGAKSTCAASGEKSAKCSEAGKAKCGDMAANVGKLLAATGAPLMTYKVGDQSTPCQKQAAEWMKEHEDAKVAYVVADKEYTDKSEALRAYGDVLNSHLESMTSIRYAVGEKIVNCPMEAQSLSKEGSDQVKFRVASFTFDDKDQADKAATAAREAAEKPTMKMVVDGKEVACEKPCDKSAQKSCHEKNADGSAKSVAAKKTGGQCCHSKGGEQVADGKKCEYVVGDMKTCCEATARVELAQARIVAAHKSIQELASGNAAPQDEVAVSSTSTGS